MFFRLYINIGLGLVLLWGLSKRIWSSYNGWAW